MINAESQRIIFDICGLPNRDRGASATASAVAGAIVAVFSVGVRMYSQLSRLDYTIGLDDYALIFSMVCFSMTIKCRLDLYLD